MKENNNEYYGQATFSLALIDINIFIETLANIEEILKDSENTLNLIESLKEQTKDSISCLEKYPLAEFCKVQRYLKHARNKVKIYQNKLVQYFSENPNKKEEFDKLLNEFKVIAENKQRFLTELIDKCFNCIKTFNNQNLIEN